MSLNLIFRTFLLTFTFVPLSIYLLLLAPNQLFTDLVLIGNTTWAQEPRITEVFIDRQHPIRELNRFNKYLQHYVAKETSKPFLHLVRDTQQLIGTIKTRCRARRLSTHWTWWMHPIPLPRKVIIRKQQRIYYASNPKTGSTSFKMFLYALDGSSREELMDINVHEQGEGHYVILDSKKDSYFYSHPQFKKTFPHYLKVGAIRNPLTRLVSAFRDKQLRKDEFDIDLGDLQGKDDGAIFTQFLRELVQEGSRLQQNIHLKPQWEQMTICSWPYDVLIPFEQEHDYIELLQDITRTSGTPYPGSRRERGLEKHDTVYYTRQYFKQVNQALLEQVYRLYQMDFVLLGYTSLKDPGFPLLLPG